MAETASLDLKCVYTIRTLSMDAIPMSNSGHPGTPMARVSIEQASTFGWARYVGPACATMGVTSFGESAALDE
ncbi:MAG: hypothetical protein EXR27_00470 [Betaproteobacteria bacterium]|nr:hypothetical protein [Betaproteobacteria bacterium]